MLVELVKQNAKALAVPVVALIVWGAKVLAENAGVTVVVDNEALTNGVAVAITAVAVWWTRNQAKTDPPEGVQP